VVGVVGDVRPEGYASEPHPEHYVPYRQVPFFAWGMTLVVRSSLPLEAVLPAVRARMRALDRTLPAELQPMEEHLGRSTTAWRLPMSIVSAFGAVALVLAALGVYTVFAFVVAQRTREIGVRMALGATSGAVLRGTLRDALAVTLAGAAIGSAAAVPLAGLARSLLLDQAAVDLRPLGFAVTVLVATAAVAAYVPGRRAARVDPMVALRAE